MPRPMGFANGQNVTAITNNPVFKVKITSLDNRFEQSQPNPKKEKKRQDSEEMKTGDVVKGRVRGGEEEYREGVVVRFDQDKSGNVSLVIIRDEDEEKEFKLDPASCKVLRKKTSHTGDEDLPFTAESLTRLPRLSRLI